LHLTETLHKILSIVFYLIVNLPIYIFTCTGDKTKSPQMQLGFLMTKIFYIRFRQYMYYDLKVKKRKNLRFFCGKQLTLIARVSLISHTSRDGFILHEIELGNNNYLSAINTSCVGDMIAIQHLSASPSTGATGLNSSREDLRVQFSLLLYNSIAMLSNDTTQPVHNLFCIQLHASSIPEGKGNALNDLSDCMEVNGSNIEGELLCAKHESAHNSFVLSLLSLSSSSSSLSSSSP